MKLYAKTTSERASKGQGGEHLRIDIQDKTKNIVYGIDVSYCGNILMVERYIYDKNIVDVEREQKGKSQKGERCSNDNCNELSAVGGQCLEHYQQDI